MAGKNNGRGSSVETGKGSDMKMGEGSGTLIGGETDKGGEESMGAKTSKGNAPMFNLINNPDWVPHSTKKNTSQLDGYFV